MCWKNGKDSSLVMTCRIKALGRCFFTASSPLGKATVFMDITLSFLCSSAISVSHSFQHQATEHCHFKSFLALTYSLSPNLVFLHRNKEVDMFYGYSSCQCSGLDGWSVVLTGTYRRHTPFMSFSFFWHS